MWNYFRVPLFSILAFGWSHQEILTFEISSIFSTNNALLIRPIHILLFCCSFFPRLAKILFVSRVQTPYWGFAPGSLPLYGICRHHWCNSTQLDVELSWVASLGTPSKTLANDHRRLPTIVGGSENFRIPRRNWPSWELERRGGLGPQNGPGFNGRGGPFLGESEGFPTLTAGGVRGSGPFWKVTCQMMKNHLYLMTQLILWTFSQKFCITVVMLLLTGTRTCFYPTSASAPAHHHVTTIPCWSLQCIEVGAYCEEDWLTFFYKFNFS